MTNEFRVIDIDSRLDITRHFQQIPKYEVQINKEIMGKIELLDGDLIEIRGNRTTAAKVVSVETDNFDIDAIGLNDLIRNNARVSPEEIVTIEKADSKVARKIVLAPIGKYLKKSELLKHVAKKSFLGTPFVEDDVTYLRSKILRYLLGSVTWLRVVKTEPRGIVVVDNDTDFEIRSDPINQNIGDSVFHHLPNSNSDDDFWKMELLNDNEREKINSLIKLGLFSNFMEAISFFLREGIILRKDIFEKSLSVAEQINHLKEDVKKDLS